MFKVKKAVITAAGLGTRLLPLTKEVPKEMLPIFVKGFRGELLLKPLTQVIFEQLYSVGIREFFIIVGRGKRAIEDYFTPDSEFIKLLRGKGKNDYAEEMERFYKMIFESIVVFLNQPEPKGFGDAVLRARGLINETFLVHAGDTYIASRNLEHLEKLIDVHSRHGCSATLLVTEVEDPRPYGVIGGRMVEDDIWIVERIEEKPDKPWSNTAILPVYIFEPEIFNCLEEVPPGKGGELQLTDGIGCLVRKGKKVMAVRLPQHIHRLDIGSPSTFWEAIEVSYDLSKTNIY
ncbi:MAG: sugar phosphate nucleotidyltransferase [Nitrososphaerota archaeon]